MYEYKKRPSKFKKIITSILLIISVAAISIFIYDMYINIDVYSDEESYNSSQAIRLSYSEEDSKKDNNDITTVL